MFNPNLAGFPMQSGLTLELRTEYGDVGMAKAICPIAMTVEVHFSCCR